MKASLAAAAIGLVVAYILTPLVSAMARRFGVVAHPGGRRIHTTPTPLLGGLGMFVAFVVAVVVVVAKAPGLMFDRQTIGILIAGSFVALMGILDDWFELPGWVQAVSILVAAFVLTRFGIEIRHITNPFKGGHMLWLGVLSIPVTMIWMLMVTKAVDCMDGVDGLAAGIAAIGAGTLMLMALKVGGGFGESSAAAIQAGVGCRIMAVMSAALMGAALGFLRFNYPPAKIFMGTIGAQFLGFTLAGIAVAGAFKIAAFVALAAPVLVLAVPLFDTTFVVVRRAVTGKRIDEADTSHLHHRLINRGFSSRQVIWVIYSITFVFCGIAYALFCSVK